MKGVNGAALEVLGKENKQKHVVLCGQFPRRTSVRHQNDRLFESNTNCKLCGKMAEVQAHAQCIPDSV